MSKNQKSFRPEALANPMSSTAISGAYTKKLDPVNDFYPEIHEKLNDIEVFYFNHLNMKISKMEGKDSGKVVIDDKEYQLVIAMKDAIPLVWFVPELTVKQSEQYRPLWEKQNEAKQAREQSIVSTVTFK